MNERVNVRMLDKEVQQTKNLASSNMPFFIQHFIQHERKMLDEMLDWFAPAFYLKIACASAPHGVSKMTRVY